jgi:hypothetical protein
MKMKIIWRAGLPVMSCAVAFCATEVWNTKVSSHWTEAEANLILKNSPWAKQVQTKSASSGVMRRGGGGRGGGMGRRGGIGGYPGGGNSAPPMSALVRWESAQTVQEAEKRLQSLHSSEDAKPVDGSTSSFGNHYVVSVIGLRAAGRQNGRNQSDEGGSRQLRDQLMTTTQLVLKNRAPIGPDDVKVKTQGGENEIEFFFPKSSPISKDDKEVTFHSVIGRMTVENKFQLKNMTRNKKLELD